MILISYSTGILEVFKKHVDVALAELGEQLDSEISEPFPTFAFCNSMVVQTSKLPVASPGTASCAVTVL